jgi:hypothetical protein
MPLPSIRAVSRFGLQGSMFKVFQQQPRLDIREPTLNGPFKE